MKWLNLENKQEHFCVCPYTLKPPTIEDKEYTKVKFGRVEMTQHTTTTQKKNMFLREAAHARAIYRPMSRRLLPSTTGLDFGRNPSMGEHHHETYHHSVTHRFPILNTMCHPNDIQPWTTRTDWPPMPQRQASDEVRLDFVNVLNTILIPDDRHVQADDDPS